MCIPALVSLLYGSFVQIKMGSFAKGENGSFLGGKGGSFWKKTPVFVGLLGFFW